MKWFISLAALLPMLSSNTSPDGDKYIYAPPDHLVLKIVPAGHALKKRLFCMVVTIQKKAFCVARSIATQKA